MPTPNPVIQQRLELAKKELADLRAEKMRIFPPNRDPLGAPDKFPGDYTPDQIAYHRKLNQQIEQLEKLIDQLQSQLFQK